MKELFYIDGEVVAEDAVARVPANDRGFNFGDGVYEVIRVYNGELYTGREHLERLHRSAAAIDLKPKHTVEQYMELCRTLVARTGLSECMIYGQVTRGYHPRDHMYPDDLAPHDFWFVRPLDTTLIRSRIEAGINLMSTPDLRWNMCEVKSISLLPNVLAKNRARKKGASEAIFFDPVTQLVTEGSASNVWAVRDGTIYTAPDGPKILPGITRAVIFRLAEQLGIPVVKKAQSLNFFKNADEVATTSSTVEIMPVRRIDDSPLPRAEESGHGPVFARIFEAFLTDIEASCGGVSRARAAC